MSANAVIPRQASASNAASNNVAASKEATTKKDGDWKGFVAGVFSGITKLTVGHPFDTIKVRLQTSTHDQFKGPMDALMQTLRKEGVNGMYKGATPPLLGWMCMDSLMLGSLTLYRRLLNENIYQPYLRNSSSEAPTSDSQRLPSFGHGIAGTGAGWTVSFIAAPVEHIKARLQVQYQADKSKRQYAGPVDCAKKIYSRHGVRGLYHGLLATMIFRTSFFFWWSTYDIFTRSFQQNTSMSTPAINFWAGGLSAQIFWLFSYPSDVVKQRIMTDPLDSGRKFPRWRDAAVAVYRESGWKGYWRGFAPCALRAFPANACALVAFEGVMRTLNKAE
ncbi:Putative mitochondrial carrier protein [Septoria linicola]|uniref:Mitochondrial carrier protein n=1 Tax=Septoria linicola TaxID=215465 RepID=A0A9Q9AJI2_9PEZI|nr:putative mitochondrial carrier protein [Septoria linicola]USW47308.1 Putative mitochondrial carrier protein [Septoria linicola]